MTPRQKSLYLAAKLYELAAEYTDSELQAMLREQSRQVVPSAVFAAIRALIQLHKENQAGEHASVESSSIERSSETPESPTRTRSLQTASLSDLFEDRVAFPAVADIAEVLQIEARPKEARDRYISRASRIVETMDSRAKAVFFNELSARLNTRPNSFISKWSKLIKEM